VTSKRRRWARWATGSSILLLLLAVFSLYFQLYPEFITAADPESNYVANVGPGQQYDFQVDDGAVLRALRVKESGEPEAELRLFGPDGEEIPGRGPGLLDSDRPGSDRETIYASVRIFEGLGAGAYTLHNDAGTSELWLVDDLAAAEVIVGNPWWYLFCGGCCLGLPLGLVGLILAVMVWSDKRKAPDQYVVIQDGSVILTDMDSIQDMQAQEGDVIETESVDGVLDPFIDEEASIQKAKGEGTEQEWKKWDEG